MIDRLIVDQSQLRGMSSYFHDETK